VHIQTGVAVDWPTLSASFHVLYLPFAGRGGGQQMATINCSGSHVSPQKVMGSIKKKTKMAAAFSHMGVHIAGSYLKDYYYDFRLQLD